MSASLPSPDGHPGPYSYNIGNAARSYIWKRPANRHEPATSSPLAARSVPSLKLQKEDALRAMIVQAQEVLGALHRDGSSAIWADASVRAAFWDLRRSYKGYSSWSTSLVRLVQLKRKDFSVKTSEEVLQKHFRAIADIVATSEEVGIDPGLAVDGCERRSILSDTTQLFAAIGRYNDPATQRDEDLYIIRYYRHRCQEANKYLELSPELFTGETARATTASDVWAFGCVMVEVLSGIHPYFEIDNIQRVIPAITQEGKKPTRPTNAHDALWDLIQDCWGSPSERPPAGVLLQRLRYVRGSQVVVLGPQ